MNRSYGWSIKDKEILEKYNESRKYHNDWTDKIRIDDSKLWILISFLIVGAMGSTGAYMFTLSDSEYCPSITTPEYKEHCYERLDSERAAVWALPLFSISIGIFMFIISNKIESKQRKVKKI